MIFINLYLYNIIIFALITVHIIFTLIMVHGYGPNWTRTRTRTSPDYQSGFQNEGQYLDILGLGSFSILVTRDPLTTLGGTGPFEIQLGVVHDMTCHINCLGQSTLFVQTWG